MSIQDINISDVLIDDSRFSSRNFLFESCPGQTCHISSFDSLGILYPIIVYKDNKGRLQLVDGKKRVQHANQNRTDKIRATVLAENTPVTDIIVLILCNKRQDIEASTINKIQFLHFASSLNAPEPWLLHTLCIPFEFKPHSDFLQECERINNLPRELKLFCHDKKFSLKQVLNLSYHPLDLLMQIIKWKSTIQLTASILDEIASNLKDYLKLHRKDINDFLSGSEINEILESSLSPRDKTDKIRKYIYMMRYPVLSETNDKIGSVIEDLNLPGNISINWDRSLENKKLDIGIEVRDPKKWTEILKKLESQEIKDAIEKTLNEL